MDTEAVKAQASAVQALQAQLDLVNIDLRRAAGEFGQDASLTISLNGVAFSPLGLGRNHMPEVRKGFEVMQAEAIKLLELKRSDIRSRLEGAQWKLRQLVKA